MQLLTDEELWALVPNADNLNDARAIEAAILAKLGAMELPPLPAYECGPHTGHAAVRTDESLKDWGKACYAQGAAAQLAQKPSAWIQPDFAPVRHDGDSLASWINAGWSPLYTRREA